MQNHDAQPPRRARREVVCRDTGGWISGPSASSPSVPARADEVRHGDVLAYEGREMTVTAVSGAWYCENGQQVAGLAVECRAAGVRWTLYRRGPELLSRVTWAGRTKTQ